VCEIARVLQLIITSLKLSSEEMTPPSNSTLQAVRQSDIALMFIAIDFDLSLAQLFVLSDGKLKNCFFTCEFVK
jgi:hypothetical protein